MTTQIQQLKEDIAILQMKLQKLEEAEKIKSPAEEAYKRVYGHYPNTERDDYGMPYNMDWIPFSSGYNAAKKEQIEPSMINCILMGNPPDGHVTWNEWYDDLGSKGILHNLKICSKNYKPEVNQPKTLLDAIRNLGYSTDCCYEIIDAVEDFYENVDDDPSPQTPEETEQSLKKAFKEAQQTEEWKKLQELIDEEDNDKNFKTSLDLIKERGEKVHKEVEKLQDKNWYADAKMDEIVEELKGQTLYDLIGEFLLDEIDYLYNTHSEREYFLEKFEQWLPKPQSAEGSQNSYVECTVDGYNDCLNQIKRKLR